MLLDFIKELITKVSDFVVGSWVPSTSVDFDLLVSENISGRDLAGVLGHSINGENDVGESRIASVLSLGEFVCVPIA